MSESGSDRTYVEQLGSVLRTADAEQLRTFLVENARRFGDQAQVDQILGQSPDDLQVLMHRMILSRSDLSTLHQPSQQWLAHRGIRIPNEAPDRQN